jgi:hypothetical protein
MPESIGWKRSHCAHLRDHAGLILYCRGPNRHPAHERILPYRNRCSHENIAKPRSGRRSTYGGTRRSICCGRLHYPSCNRPRRWRDVLAGRAGDDWSQRKRRFRQPGHRLLGRRAFAYAWRDRGCERGCRWNQRRLHWNHRWYRRGAGWISRRRACGLNCRWGRNCAFTEVGKCRTHALSRNGP